MRVLPILCLAACSPGVALTDGGSAGGGSAGGGASDSGQPVDAGIFAYCTAAVLADPPAATTYYVAAQEPGADNAACDGLAPTRESSTRCPFKDFTSQRVRQLLVNAQSVRVEVRAGTYLISGWDGLEVRGTGTSRAESVVLSSYAGERAVLDVANPAGDGCYDGGLPVDGGATPAACVHHIVRVSGRFTIVQGLWLQNGHGYVGQFNTGDHHEWRCNHFSVTHEALMRADMLKGSGQADSVEIHHNEFTGWSSQAIDMTTVSNVVVHHNDFHHPGPARGNGAVGIKYGSHGIVLRDNLIHDFGFTEPGRAAAGGGGTSITSMHPDEFTAYDVHIRGNRFWNHQCVIDEFTSCGNCSFEDNLVVDGAAGVHFNDMHIGHGECASSDLSSTVGSEAWNSRDLKSRPH